MTAHLPAGHGQLPLLPAAHEYLVRQLHLLFEPTDKSFSHTLLAMRLVEARRQLESIPHLTVTEIALACGFDTLPPSTAPSGKPMGWRRVTCARICSAPELRAAMRRHQPGVLKPRRQKRPPVRTSRTTNSRTTAPIVE
jgi:AraC-like DNA-binding protein